MTSSNLWPAGGIIARLASPFGPAMGARLVNWARHRRHVGPIVRWLFPEEIGTPPSEREAEPEVSPDPNAHVCLTADAVRDAVQGGLEAAGATPELIGEVRELRTLLQQLVDGQRQILAAMERPTNTYTVTVQHGPPLETPVVVVSFQQPGHTSERPALLRSAGD
ncbi:hypothetical protein LTR67_005974 [Exophiala xenobiotica]